MYNPFNCRVQDQKEKQQRTAMYTFNLLPFDSAMNNKTNNGIDMANKMNTEECSINELKLKIAQILSLAENSFGTLNYIN